MLKRLNTFVLALVLISSLWPTVTVAQSALPPTPYHSVWGRLGAAPGDTGPAQAIPFATLANQLAQSGIGSVYAVTPASAPLGGLPLFAKPTATGSGNCLSLANACTLATACSFAKQISTFVGSAGPINLADGSGGSYATATNGALCNIAGDGGGSSTQLISINGNAVTPTNVVLQVPSGAGGFIIQDFGVAGINNLEITAVNGAGPGIQCRQLAICDYSNISWGTWGNSGSHVSVTGGASSNPGSETLLANFLVHWNLSDGAHLNAVGTTTIPSAVDFSASAFLSASNSNIDLSSWTITGNGVAGSTGQRASLVGAGYLTTAGNATCNSVLPGNSGCVLLQGYQDSANDASTLSGLPIPLTTASNAITNAVAMNNTSNYFDGPSMAQGTTGTWWVSGVVTVLDTTNGWSSTRCKLWDGTTVIASGEVPFDAGNAEAASLALSGFLVSPAANIKISCRNISDTTGSMIANVDGASNTASKISGMRIK